MADTTTRDRVTATVRRSIRGLRQPEYTGENRCHACTLVNLVFAEIVAIAVGTWSIPAGVAVFAAAATVVYLRGYLVPGTPELTRRYLPEPVLRLFGKDGSQVYGMVVDQATDGGSGDVPTLREAGIAVGEDAETTNPDGGDRKTDSARVRDRLDPVIRAAVAEEYDRIADDHTDVERRLASALGVDLASVAAVSGLAVYRIEGDLVRWESPSALHADLALASAFAGRMAGWERYEVVERIRLLAAGRACLDDCPACGSVLERSILTTRSCCRDPESTLSVGCSTCGVRLLERDADEIEATTGSGSRGEEGR